MEMFRCRNCAVPIMAWGCGMAVEECGMCAPKATKWWEKIVERLVRGLNRALLKEKRGK